MYATYRRKKDVFEMPSAFLDRRPRQAWEFRSFPSEISERISEQMQLGGPCAIYLKLARTPHGHVLHDGFVLKWADGDHTPYNVSTMYSIVVTDLLCMLGPFSGPIFLGQTTNVPWF
jgi:hypothetical protein